MHSLQQLIRTGFPFCAVATKTYKVPRSFGYKVLQLAKECSKGQTKDDKDLRNDTVIYK